LTSWLKQYSDASLEETNRLAAAQEAIRAIGPERSMPILLKLLTSEDDRIDKWVLETSDRFKLDSLRWQTEVERELEGVAGFEVLGSNAAPAVGALTRLLDDPDRAFTGSRALISPGCLEIPLRLCRGVRPQQTALKESADLFERGVGGSQTRDRLEAVRHSLPDVERDAQARVGNLLGVAKGVV
jgi:hypothetical protein